MASQFYDCLKDTVRIVWKINLLGIDANTMDKHDDAFCAIFVFLPAVIFKMYTVEERKERKSVFNASESCITTFEACILIL